MNPLSKRIRTDLIVIHCAATPPDLDIGAKEIDKWHKERGWSGIGYHYVIRRDGKLETGRDLDAKGAHVKGHNDYSVGICLVGGVDSRNKPENNFTSTQFKVLNKLLDNLMEIYPEAVIVGHTELDKNKACPSFDVERYIPLVEEQRTKPVYLKWIK